MDDVFGDVTISAGVAGKVTDVLQDAIEVHLDNLAKLHYHWLQNAYRPT